MPHRTAQCALLGAVHGIEQHCAGLFAEWNHQALLQHAQHVANALLAGAPRKISSNVSPSHAELQTQSPLSAAGSAPPQAFKTFSAQHSGVSGGQSEQQSMEEQHQASHTREASHAPQPSSTGSCSHVLRASTHADDCTTIASIVDSTAGSMAATKAAGPLAECPLQPSAPQAHQPLCCPVEGTESVSGMLQAVLKGPLSSAKALAVLAAVQTGAASLGLAAGLSRMPWPLYLIGTRDSFTHHLHAEQSRVSPHTIAPPYTQKKSHAALLRPDWPVSASLN